MSNHRQRGAASLLMQAAGRLTRRNPPGLRAISYRGAAYQNALERMLRRLPVQTLPGEELCEPPLAHLNTEADDDWTVALLHAWAVVTDVLTFYQERILNEGYLRTATERRSVLELARSVGYELHPGLSASTDLAFTVQSGAGNPPCQVEIPAGAAVRGMSPTAKLPEGFETSQTFTARSEWNSLRLAGDDRPKTILPGTTSIRLVGEHTYLKVGDRMLFVGEDQTEAADSRNWLLAVVSKVQVEVSKNTTLITWRDAIWKPDPSQALRNARLYLLSQPVDLFGYSQAAVDWVPAAGDRGWPAGIGLPYVEIHALVCNRQGHLFAGTQQDVFRSVDNGAIWQPAPTGALRRNVTALAVGQGGALYAGTDEGGVYLSQDAGHHWTAMCGEAVVQSPKWLRKWFPFLFSSPLPKTIVRCLVAFQQRGKPILAAGTGEGAFRSADQGRTWQPCNFDLPGLDWKTGGAKTPVWALAVLKRGWGQQLFAGTDAGVFRLKGSPRFWPLLILSLVLAYFINKLPDTWMNFGTPLKLLNAPLTFLIDFLLAAAFVGLLFFIFKTADRFINSREKRCLGLPVHALAVGASGRLFAGTTNGLYRLYGPIPSPDAGGLRRLWWRLKTALVRDWRLVTGESEVQDIRALSATPSQDVFAGSAAGEVFRLNQAGEGWRPLESGPSLAVVQSILATQQGVFAAGTPVKEKIEKRWTRAQVLEGHIDLDPTAAAAGVSPRWVVLQQGEDVQQARLYRVHKAALANSQDFSRPGKLTRLVVDDNAGLETFDRQISQVWAGSEHMPLFDDQPVWGDNFILQGVVPGLTIGQRLIFSGKRPCLQLVGPNGDLSLRSTDGLRSAPLLEGELLYLLSPALPPDPGDEQLVQWHLKNRRGFSGFVTAARGAFIPVPALEEVESAAEVALVEEVAYQEHTTCIRLRAALENVYDSFSLVIYGNVVPARQGRTVLYEVLGSGDGSQANQCFRLRQGPLSFYSAPVPSGMEAALAVQVNGVTWHPAPFLYGLEKDSRAYIVRQDARGNTEIIFGDGEHGARLPSGYEQITATYSVGIGPEGNVPAGSLNLLQSALPGIDSVTNPLRPAGGAGPESLERARQNAPLSTRTVERIVSLADYEDFVRCFAGVGKAQARWLHTSTGDVLHITLADLEGQPVPRTSALYQMLVQAIAENRGTSEPRVCIDSFEPVYFNLRARLRIERDQRSRLRDIEAAVRKEIERSFAFDAREFGLEVSASGLLSLMQAIPGVMAVQLVHLYPSCEQAGLAQVLEAGLARWQAGSLLPAQMLLVNSAPEGIVLDQEVAE